MGIGTDNIDKHYLDEHNIELLSQPQAGIHDTAELAVTLMLALARKIIPNHQYTQSNQWAENKSRFLGNHLFEKQAGLVGLGQIGLKIAHFCQAFGMKITYTARRDRYNPYTYYQSINLLALDSDYLIICCSGGSETQNLINEQVLANLGPNGYLVNVARGSVVDQQALINALNEKKIAGAGLDVYIEEPKVSSALRNLDNVILSPHMGSSTRENLDHMFATQAQQLNNYIQETGSCTDIKESFV